MTILLTMQRFVALFLVCTLLSVSSVPMLSQAVPHHQNELSSHLSDMHEQDEQMQHQQLQSSPDVMRIKDCRQVRIECGCGCHRSTDALPHLLAPHEISQLQFKTDIFSMQTQAQLRPVFTNRPNKVSVPPPRQFIF